MLFPVMVDTKLREGLMSSRIFVREQSTRIICTRHTPKNIYMSCTTWNFVQLGIFGKGLRPVGEKLQILISKLNFY